MKQNKFPEESRFITQLFDTQPDAVVWFVPRFDAADKTLPTDFEVGYCNTAASHMLNTSKSQLTGSAVRSSTLMEETSRQIIWEQCLEVWRTAKNLEFTYFSPGLNKHLHVQRSKILGGILCITRDHTNFIINQKEQQEQSKLLNQIIETSSSGISLYEAIRDKKGKLLDFKLRMANKKCADITAFSLEELHKYTVKELMMIRGQFSFFEIVSKVTETGEPVYTEYFSESRNQWIALSIQKFNDGYLLNYIDITVTKNLEKKAKDQADMLNGILNASITGLLTLHAIFDASGRIDDFKFGLLNAAAEKIMGIKEEDKGKTYLTLFPNARTNGFFNLYKNSLTTGEPVSKEFFYKGEGYNGWYHISISKMNKDTLVQSFADITQTRDPKASQLR